jgi:hypothetical protein
MAAEYPNIPDASFLQNAVINTPESPRLHSGLVCTAPLGRHKIETAQDVRCRTSSRNTFPIASHPEGEGRKHRPLAELRFLPALQAESPKRHPKAVVGTVFAVYPYACGESLRHNRLNH